ncbi:hypothetical protein [Haloarcula hispanica]|uniref:hypothetical protein n=1 Tax=Haloarcula hispanica TaxID=51589 RepID=UPI00119820A5|nr:hypothetical protein [Haloarcula hispanica]QRG24218.1 hypothetical protein HarHp1_110 [Haloarcula virus Harhisp1]
METYLVVVAELTPVSNTASQPEPAFSLLSFVIGVGISLLSAILVYILRQLWEKKKLHRALLTEVEQMDGIATCKDQMERIGEPPNYQLSSDDVPAPDSIPTTVYESTASNIGLIGGIRAPNELKGVVKFYSKVLKYKSIIKEIGDRGNKIRFNGEDEAEEVEQIPISDDDQEDLYNSITHLNTVRNRIIEARSFDVAYPEELES